MRVVIMILVLLAPWHNPAAAQMDSTKILGSTVRLDLAGRRAPVEEGELIATSRDSLGCCSLDVWSPYLGAP